MPLASSLTRGLSPDRLGFASPPLTPEEQQELADYRQKREAFRRGESIPQGARRPVVATGKKVGSLKKAPGPNREKVAPSSQHIGGATSQLTGQPPVKSGAVRPPSGKAIVGTGHVNYGTQPGGLEADMYADIMRAAGYIHFQDSKAQRALLSPGYKPPEPTQWTKNSAPQSEPTYAPRPGHGVRVDYQDTLRVLNYLNVPDHAAQQEMSTPGYRPPKPTQWAKEPDPKAPVPYGSHPGGAEAIAYQELMRSLGNYNVQNYRVQNEILTPGYQAPEPNDWHPFTSDKFDELFSGAEDLIDLIERQTGERIENPLSNPADGRTYGLSPTPRQAGLMGMLSDVGDRAAGQIAQSADIYALVVDDKEARLGLWKPDWRRVDDFDNAIRSFQRMNDVDLSDHLMRPKLERYFESQKSIENQIRNENIGISSWKHIGRRYYKHIFDFANFRRK